MSALPNQSDLTGRTIKGYEFRSRLGAGGFGAVYSAYQAIVEREVAIKVILPAYANQPDFIRRFENEAQLIARLEHLHIVPLHDYWREPDGAYLVMRWLQGGSLRSKISKEALSLETIAGILDQVASALTAAHRRKIVHRDLKPDNILLDEDGNAYLADFGIATTANYAPDPSAQELFVGSPAYLAPEQIMGEPVTQSTDIYSLGVTLYELLTSNPPFSGNTMQLLHHHLNDPLPSVRIVRPNTPKTVDDVIQKATHKMPAQRYPDALSVALAYRKAIGSAVVMQQTASHSQAPHRPPSVDNEAQTVIGMDTPVIHVPDGEVEAADARTMIQREPSEAITFQGKLADIENPYRGLRAFQEVDAANFFGRTGLVNRLIARLQETSNSNDSDNDLLSRFLAVVGPSGSGKSSVVRAGLIPALRQDALPGSTGWYIVEMIPGARPFEELESALLKVAVKAPENLLEQLKRDEQGLLNTLGQILPETGELVLVIDQFEEIFTLIDNEAERKLLLDSLQEALTAPQSRLRIIITLRADFYDRPLLYPDLGELIRKRTELVLPLNQSELREAIVKPAEQVGVRFESGLVDSILKDIAAQPGALPLLQYALTELFEQRKGEHLTLAVYHDKGGVFGALARRADELYNALDGNGREAARQLFLRLINFGEGTENTRRRVQRTELPTIQSDTKIMDKVIDVFARARLLTLDRDPVTRGPTVEVAHEALLRTWKPLQTWIENSREDIEVQRRFAAATTEWINTDRDPGFLASGTRLNQYEDWAAQTSFVLNKLEQDYLEASLADQTARRAADDARKAREVRIAQRAQNFGRATVVLAMVGVLALVSTGVAVNQSNAAQQAVMVSGQTLTPIPPTLTAVQVALDKGQEQVESQRKTLNALNLASGAVRELNSNRPNPELAALLAIRSLKIVYDPLADAALMQAMDRVYSIGLFQHNDYVTAVSYSPDGNYALTGSVDKNAYLWEIASGKQIQKFVGHSETVVGVAYSPSGKYILTTSRDFTAKLWDANTGDEIRTFKGHEAGVLGGAFSPDENYVVTGSDDTTAILWDANTGNPVHQYIGHQGAIRNVAFSPDGKMMATASYDTTVGLWDMTTGESIYQLIGHTNYVWSAVFSPDSKSLLTSAVDSTARLWNVTTGKEIRQYVGHDDAVWGAVFSPDGKRIMTASIDYSARLWDTETAEQLRVFWGHNDIIAGVAFAPDGQTALTASRDHTARLWDVSERRHGKQLIGHEGAVGSALYLPGEKFIVTSGFDNTARLWDAETLQEVRKFSGHTNSITAIALSPDGKLLLTASGDNTARLWDIETGKTVFVLSGHTNMVFAAAFSPDGKTVLTGGYDNTTRLWDVETGKELRRYGSAGLTTAVAYSPDGKYVVTAGDGTAAKLWDTETGDLIREFSGHSAEVGALAFSADGKLLVTGSFDHTARVWEVATGKTEIEIVGHSDNVHTVSFMPYGKGLLTGSDDHTARLWDLATGKEIRRFAGHTASVLGITPSMDGKTVLTASTDGTVRFWDTNYRDFINSSCDRLVSDLTDSQRQRFDIADKTATCE